MKKIFRLTILILLIVAPLLISTGAMENCEAIIQHHETRHGIPAGLLRAISRIESGRFSPGQGVMAWPWTINANGKAYYLDTKQQAIAKAKQLQSEGITSMDVGPMQINLKHHPDAFADLEEAFDPWKNIAYAAQFLVQKKNAQGNWQTAVAHYHSATASFNIPYRDKVMESWTKNGGISPTQTVFNMNAHQPVLAKSSIRNTLFSSRADRRIPVKVKFGRHMKGGQIRSRPASATLISTPVNAPSENPHSIISRPSGGNVSSLMNRRVSNARPLPSNRPPAQKKGSSNIISAVSKPLSTPKQVESPSLKN